MTFQSFRFTSKFRSNIFKNLSKNHPKSTYKWTWKPSKTIVKKTTKKKNPKSTKSQNLASQLGPWGGVAKSIFDTFSARGVPGTPLVHPRGSQWSQDLPQEPPGPPRASIFRVFEYILGHYFEGFGCSGSATIS